MLKTLHLYTNDLNRKEVESLPCMAGYHIEKHAWEGNAFRAPDEGLAVIYHPQEVANLWDVIEKTEHDGGNVAFLLILDREDFSIAYKAVGFFHVSLILQSEERAEWNRCVTGCLDRIKNMEQVLADRAQLEEYEYRKNHKIMERLLTNIISKPEQVEFLLPEINKRYGTNLGEGDYQVLIIHVDRYELCSQSSRFLKEVTLLMTHMLPLAKELIAGYQEPYGLIGIVHYDKNNSRYGRKTDYEKLLDRIMDLKRQYGEFRITLSIGKTVGSISLVRTSMKEAALAKDYRIVCGKPLIYASEVEALEQDMEKYLSTRKRKELIRYITLGDIRHANSWFLEFHQNIEPQFMNYPPAFSYVCWQIYNDIAEHEKTAQKGVFPEWKFVALQHIFDVKERIRQLETLLLEICHMMAEGMAGEQDVAVKAIAYMKVHFKEPINLDFIAEKCGLSTSYFSRKFKEQTGENYIDVLTDIRIREAQKLLGTTDLSIGEIIDAVGYCDDKHFRKLFSKVTGMKPTEYRKKIRAEKNFR